MTEDDPNFYEYFTLQDSKQTQVFADVEWLDSELGLTVATSAVFIGNSTPLSTERWSSMFGLETLSQHFMVYWNSTMEDLPYVPITTLSTPSYTALMMDGLCKSLYSTILADLGQSVPSDIFADPGCVMDFVNQSVGIFRSQDVSDVTGGLSPDFTGGADEIIGFSPNISDEEWPPDYRISGWSDQMLNGLMWDTAPHEPTAFFKWANTSIPKVEPSV